MAHKHENMFNLISNQENDLNDLNPSETPFHTLYAGNNFLIE